MENEALKIELAEELKKEMRPFVEEVKRTITETASVCRLHELLLQEVLVSQLMGNLNPLNTAQRYRANIISLIEKRSDLSEPVRQALLSQALTFFDQLVAVFERAEEDRPSLVC